MYQYRRKIRSDKPRTYLWGSENIERRYKGGGALVIHVEDMSEPITLFIVKERPLRDDEAEIGKLEAGEVLTLALHQLEAVFAKPPAGQDAFVTCAILETEFQPE